MKENYTYPVILDYTETNIINIIIPDFNGISSCVDLKDDVVEAAQELLTALITDYENEGKETPVPSKIQDIKITDGQQIVLVNIWMPYHRSKVKEVYIKKNLTIPEWLNILAVKNNINFSSTLVEALKEKLNLK